MDSRFQEANRTGGLDFAEAKQYFSNKHKLYGFKCEVAVLPNGLCIHSAPHVRRGALT